MKHIVRASTACSSPKPQRRSPSVSMFWPAVAAALLLCAAFSAAVRGQQPPAASPGAASKATSPLGDLERALLEGLPPPAAEPAPGKRPRAPDLKEPAPVPQSADANPLARVSAQMRQVQDRLAARDTSEATQAAQQAIVRELAALLAASKPQPAPSPASAASSSSRPQPVPAAGDPQAGRPAAGAAGIERGQVEPAAAGDPQSLVRRAWGHLPDRLREQMQAALGEQFLPKYERIIEAYFERLAEEQASRQ